jgi:hypothetical protein
VRAALVVVADLVKPRLIWIDAQLLWVAVAAAAAVVVHLGCRGGFHMRRRRRRTMAAGVLSHRHQLRLWHQGVGGGGIAFPHGRRQNRWPATAAAPALQSGQLFGVGRGGREGEAGGLVMVGPALGAPGYLGRESGGPGGEERTRVG